MSVEGRRSGVGGGGRRRHRQLKPRPGSRGEGVAAHQRGRLVASTIELIHERGYSALTVGEIARTAGVSKQTFYEHFKDKEDCFLAVYDIVVKEPARQVLAAHRDGGGSLETLRAEFAAFAGEIGEKPEAAYLALIEVFAAGEPGLARVRHTVGLYATLVDECLAAGEAGVRLPPPVLEGIVTGIARVARARLLAGRADELAAEGERVMDWILALRSPAAAAACELLPPTRATDREPGPEPLNPPEHPDRERAMICAAAAEIAAEHGYPNLSAKAICALTGAPPRRFQAHFASVEECFLAAVELRVGGLLVAATAAHRAADSWPRGIYAALEAICRRLATDRVLAALVFREIFAPGPPAMRWSASFTTDLAAAFAAGAPPAQRPGPLAAEASIGAAWGVLCGRALTAKAPDLPRLTGAAAYLVLAPAIGAKEAAELIGTERRRAIARARLEGRGRRL